MAQASHPTFINLPPPGSNPDTPSEMPGTPTSTTTSLSALSTTAIKDGHRGSFPQGPLLGSRHSHNPSSTSLEAERADRISRLAGLERVSTLRAPPPNQNNPHAQNSATLPAPGPNQSHLPAGTGSGAAVGAAIGGATGGHGSSQSPQTTPTSTQGVGVGGGGYFPQAAQHNLTPAYFDSNGQPYAVTKLSTVGTASATESHLGDESRTTAGERDEDMFSTDTNYPRAGSVASIPDAMDEDPDPDADGDGNRSVGGYEDRMSDDDGSASLVGFGEGAGSTVSGPIYHRRPMPSAAAAVSPFGPPQPQRGVAAGLERTNSGMSDVRRETLTGTDTPSSIGATAAQERRDARMVDGIAASRSPALTSPSGDTLFVDTTALPAGGQSSMPSAYHQQPQPPQQQAGSGNDTAQGIVQRLDHGEGQAGAAALGSPGRGGDALGKFYLEDHRGRRDEDS